jgi:UDP-glucose 4-epimerase
VRVVVTGGAGFIGANLCRALASTPGVNEVIAFDDLSTGSEGNVADQPGVQLVKATILDADALDVAFAGASAVVHLAARPSVPRSLADPMASHEANTTGTAMVLEAARRAGSPHVIVASSSSVYGANPTIPKHEDLVPMPLSPYAATKLAEESYTLAWAHSFGMRALAFRFFNVFGPLQTAGHAYAAVIPAFVDAALADRPLIVHGDGGQTRDFTFVGSVVGILAEAVARGVTSNRPVNLAFGSRVSLLELISELEAVVGHAVAVEHVEPRLGDVRDSQADQGRLRALFPDVAPIGLRTGLEATVDWFRSLSP